MGLVVAIATIVGTLALCGVIVWFLLKKMKNESYRGVITGKRKRETEDANDNVTVYYYLDIELETGGQKQVRLGRKLWEQFDVGDTIVKEAGKYNPTKG